MKRVTITLSLISIYTCTIRTMDQEQPRSCAAIMGSPGKRMIIGAGAEVVAYAQGKGSVAIIQDSQVDSEAKVRNMAFGGGSASISDCEIGEGVSVINSAGSSDSDDEGPQIIRGSGKKANKNLIMPIITSIHATGPGRVVIHPGASNNTIRVEADDNILEYCEPTVNGEQLVLNSEAHNFSSVTPITYHLFLTGPRRALLASIIAQSPISIKAPIGHARLILEHNGDERFDCEEKLKVQELIIHHSGKGNMSLKSVDIAQQLILTHASAGSLTLGGSVPHALCTLTGAGTMDASRLGINTLVLHHSGAGLLTCYVKQALSGAMYGAGAVKNYGRGNNQGLKRLGVGSYTQIDPAKLR